MHANELNSVWFGTLADRLAEGGYEYVSLTEALQDPVYDLPDTFVGAGGITWLHRWAISRNVDPKMLLGEPETPDYVLKLAGL